MRMLCFRRALLDFSRRWGLYLVIAAAIFGAGSNAPLTVVAGAASLLLWPLRAAADRDWLIVPATLAYAVVGTLPVVLTRPLWWPRRWVDAERALPLSPDTVRRSDRLFGALVMLPWQALLLAGWIGIALHGHAHDGLHRWLAFGGWVAAAAGSLWLSLHWMRFVRRPASRGVDFAKTRRRNSRHATSTRALGTRRALVVLPLWRGRARASAGLLIVGSIASVGCATLASWTNLSIGWTLALLAVVALATTSLLRSRTTRELRPLWHEARQLPLDFRACDRAQRLLVLTPSLGGIVACVLAASGSPSARPTVLAFYACALAVGCGIESRTTENMDATHHAARWILLLAVAVALGSEVAP